MEVILIVAAVLVVLGLFADAWMYVHGSGSTASEPEIISAKSHQGKSKQQSPKRYREVCRGCSGLGMMDHETPCINCSGSGSVDVWK